LLHGYLIKSWVKHLDTKQKINRKVSVAPMMDCTDRHDRFFLRLMSKNVMLYTEMVATKSAIHGDRKKILSFSPAEKPLALQVGGSNKEELAEVAKIAEDMGYDEININLGCPSKKVQKNKFGACLIKEPDLVAECINSMVNACKIPVTAKTRIGFDDTEEFDYLNNFIHKMRDAGSKTFILHARKAILKGLNPKQNRTIPPLNYDVVKKLKKSNPELLIEINGGLTNINESLKALDDFDGVMIGRSIYKHPLRWSEIDQRIYGINKKPKSASNIIFSLIPYIEEHLSNGGKSWDICKHLINLVEGIPKAKIWRNQISNKSIKKELNIEYLFKLTKALEEMGY